MCITCPPRAASPPGKASLGIAALGSGRTWRSALLLNLNLDTAPKAKLLWALGLALAAVGALQIVSLLRFQPPGMDFLPLWTAGRMALSEPGRVYDFAAVTHAQAWLLPPHFAWMRPFAYPPTALLVLAPLGALPFWAALTVWLTAGLAAFLYA